MRKDDLVVDGILPAPLTSDRRAFAYSWPYQEAINPGNWRFSETGQHRIRRMPETQSELAVDSRWPAFFPSSICLVTTSSNGELFLEKVVGASIVNRFPYVVMLSFCRQPLSERHYVRRTFMDAMESSERVAIQFVLPGPKLQAIMTAIAEVPEDWAGERLRHAGLPLSEVPKGAPPVFHDSYLVYEGRLVKPTRDFEGQCIYPEPWMDIGSHRSYFFEVETIGLREDIAAGLVPLQWRSLPTWPHGPSPPETDCNLEARRDAFLARSAFVKGYQPDYLFPGPGTIAFEADEIRDGRAIKHLLPLGADQVEIDNDRARWPCFFPSSVALLTVAGRNGAAGAMSCGSTTIIARYPLTIAVCVSYACINERYAPRASLELFTNAERFGCGVPYHAPHVLTAISYLGNVSRLLDPDKATHSGLTPVEIGGTTAFSELPIHYGCRIVGSIPLGTHRMFLGRVEEIAIRPDLSEATPLEWCPWAGLLAL